MRCQPRQLLTVLLLLTAIVTEMSCGATEGVGSTDSSNHHALAQLSSRFINIAFERDVDDRRTISEFVLGSAMNGLVHTRGRVVANLIPNERQAALEVHLKGTAALYDNVAERRAVTIYSSALTGIDARKRVLINEQGLDPQSAVANCVSQVQVNDVVARRRFIEALAWRKVDRMQQQFEQAASERAEVRAAQQLDLECDALLGDADRAFREKVREPLVRAGVWPTRLHTSSTMRHLQLSAMATSGSQQAWPASTPDLNPLHDVVVSLHESIVADVCEKLLGHKTITDRQLLEFTRIITGDSPRQLWVHDRSEGWHVTAVKELPVIVEFADDYFTLTVRLQQVARGSAQLDRPLAIITKYNLLKTAEGPILNRQGDLMVQFSDTQAATHEETELISFVQKKFSAVFPPEIHFDGLVPPAGGSWEKLRQMELKEFTANRGWIVLGYQLPINSTSLSTVEAKR